jgi:hypothetical protein
MMLGGVRTIEECRMPVGDHTCAIASTTTQVFTAGKAKSLAASAKAGSFAKAGSHRHLPFPLAVVSFITGLPLSHALCQVMADARGLLFSQVHKPYSRNWLLLVGGNHLGPLSIAWKVPIYGKMERREKE